MAEPLPAGCPSCHPTNSFKALKDDSVPDWRQQAATMLLWWDNNTVHCWAMTFYRSDALPITQPKHQSTEGYGKARGLQQILLQHLKTFSLGFWPHLHSLQRNRTAKQNSSSTSSIGSGSIFGKQIGIVKWQRLGQAFILITKSEYSTLHWQILTAVTIVAQQSLTQYYDS